MSNRPGVRRSQQLLVAAAALTSLVVVAPAASAAVAPRYVRSIGGGMSGHAEMYPSGLDMDDAGTIYVADTGDDQIQAYTASGTLSWVVGSRGSKALGRYSNPRDVAYQSGKVYVADTGYKRVQVLDADTGAALNAWSYNFGTIMGISAGVDAAGSPIILVAETHSNTIKVFTPGGSLIRTVGEPGAGNGQLGGLETQPRTRPAGSMWRTTRTIGSRSSRPAARGCSTGVARAATPGRCCVRTAST